MIPRRRRWLAAALAPLVAVVAGAAPAGGSAASSPGGRPLVAETVGGLSAELAGVVVEDGTYREAFDAWSEAGRRLAAAERDRGAAEARLVDLTAARDRLAAVVAVRQERRQRAAVAREAARARLVDLAVAAFIGDDSAAWLGTVLEGLDDGDESRRAVLGGAAQDAGVDDLRRATADLDRTVAEAREAAAALEQVEIEHGEVSAARHAAEGRARHWAAAGERHRQTAADAAPLAVVAGTDLRAVVLDAYWRGATDRGSACGLPWPVLAGIGRVETRHGTYRGAGPDARGDVRPRILGIPLDGTNGTRALGDSDGGRLDGDPNVDRAVGPMQFIPSTWARHGVDGNHDGVADPDNLYDAAASAAGYLCRVARGPVTSDEALHRAVLGYNRSEAYVAAVLGHAVVYGQLVVPVPPT